jgi:hypothetical protein
MRKKYKKEDLIEQCRELYKTKGISALVYKNIDKKIYYRLYQNGINQKRLFEILNLGNEYLEYESKAPYEYRGEVRQKWSWERIKTEVKEVVVKQNFLPPAGWFNENGYQSLVQQVYILGKTWENLRDEFNSFSSSSFVTSRNGLRWRSHPEASLSNFFHTRNIEHYLGKKYPADYSEITGQTYGYYDLMFIDKNGQQINVEIWGEKPHGHDEEHYAYKKELKESYNRNKENFLGINFRDCFNEDVLSITLYPYIGSIEPFIFEKNHDKIIPSTHWSNADELIEYCKSFTESMPDKIFPTEEWLRKRSKWKNREGEAYNTLSIYIKSWIGGIRKLREILGQSENSTVKWDKELIAKEYFNIYEKYGMTTGQLRGQLRRKQIEISKAEKDRIINIDASLRKYYESAFDINEQLGIKNARKKTIKESGKTH